MELLIIIVAAIAIGTTGIISPETKDNDISKQMENSINVNNSTMFYSISQCFQLSNMSKNSLVSKLKGYERTVAGGLKFIINRFVILASGENSKLYNN